MYERSFAPLRCACTNPRDDKRVANDTLRVETPVQPYPSHRQPHRDPLRRRQPRIL